MVCNINLIEKEKWDKNNTNCGLKWRAYIECFQKLENIKIFTNYWFLHEKGVMGSIPDFGVLLTKLFP